MEEDYEHQTSRVLFSWSSYSVWGEPISPRQNSCQRACQKSNQLSAHLKAPWLALILKVLSVQYREGKYIENARARALNKSYPLASLYTRATTSRATCAYLTLLTILKAGRTKASEWATALNNSADSLAGAIIPFEDEVFRWVESVDKRLVNCP
jgi:hypothetical protein